MMKLKKLLPTLLLILVLVWLFLPNTGETTQTPAATATPASELALHTPAPEKTPKPSPAQTPKPTAAPAPTAEPAAAEEKMLDEDGSYTTKEDVALYIHTFGHLPQNFIKKKDAEAAGWSGGSLERVLPGMCIGGDYFGNYEGQLPKANGRKWTECDINTLGARSRGAERIVFSNDGLIYYTPDHYETFELLYD